MLSHFPNTSYFHTGCPARSLLVGSEISLRLSLDLKRELFLRFPHQSTYFGLTSMFSLLNFEYSHKLQICWNLQSQHSSDPISIGYLRATPQLLFNNDQATSFWSIFFCSSFHSLSHSMSYLVSILLLSLAQVASLFFVQGLRYLAELRISELEEQS